MKDKYYKPKLFVETFTLSEHVAGACGNGGFMDKDNEDPYMQGPTARDTTSCKYKTGNGDYIFNSNCDVSPDVIGTDDYEIMCYNLPAGSFVIFGS